MLSKQTVATNSFDAHALMPLQNYMFVVRECGYFVTWFQLLSSSVLLLWFCLSLTWPEMQAT